MGKDLGTYHIKVELADGRGYIQTWETGHRYTYGQDGCYPLNSKLILPPWNSEEDLFYAIDWQYTEGNYSCDCNKSIFLARSHQLDDEPWDTPCGDTMVLKRLTAIRPDGTEKILIENKEVVL